MVSRPLSTSTRMRASRSAWAVASASRSQVAAARANSVSSVMAAAPVTKRSRQPDRLRTVRSLVFLRSVSTWWR
ncbi:hypothetical protein ACFOEY_15205 [Paracandidimonas soli]|uniref:hypothetical protein n=1 Tax=Paracandidimonas soli TaxID=1917182 RepID=UPI00360AB2BB